MKNILRFTPIFIILFLSLNSFAGFNTLTKDKITDPEITAEQKEIQKEFLENLKKFCNKSFSGQQNFIAPGKDCWADEDLEIHVTLCGDNNKVYIGFHISEDRSRTWRIILEDVGLRLRHDHRDEEGNPDDINLYGGYASAEGTTLRQRFYTDEYTANMVGDNVVRSWEIELSEDLKSLFYRLYYNGGLRVFEGEFDLTQEIR